MKALLELLPRSVSLPSGRVEVVPLTGTALVPVPQTLTEIATAIYDDHRGVIEGMRTSLEHAFQAGRRLIEAKGRVKEELGHGAWERYVNLDCRLNMRTVQNYMLIARQEPKLAQILASKTLSAADLTYSKALQLLSAAKQERRRPAKPR